MNIRFNSIRNSKSLYKLLKFMLENGINFDIWRSEIPPKQIGLFRHPKIAHLFLDYPITTVECGVRIYTIFEVCVSVIDDDKLAKWLSNYFAVGKHFYEMFVNGIIFQCLVGAKMKSIQSFLHVDMNKYIKQCPQIEAFLTQLHYVENGVIMPCWQPNIVAVLESLNAPVTLFIPSEINKDSYVMDYSSVFGEISKCKACIPSYHSEGTYFWKTPNVEFLTLITFHSKELMYQWWETVKNITI